MVTNELAPTKTRVLICDDDETFHLAVKYSLKNAYQLKSAYSADEALAILKKNYFDLILMDVSLESKGDGIRLIQPARELNPDAIVIMSSGFKDIETIRESMRSGAFDYLPKDFEPEQLHLTFERAVRFQIARGAVEKAEFEKQKHHEKNVMVGQSPSMVQLRKIIERARSSDLNILITGETGTGKELVARLLRQTNEDGSLAPFVCVDSATILASTAESVLFGHEKGAFTGADKCKRGLFEEAHTGTLYFDEIGNMPIEIQAKLLRVIQEKEVLRLGSSRPIHLEFRIIAATNKSLEQMVSRGEFLPDLYQRLCVIPIDLPSLKNRPEDIPALVDHFMRIHNPTTGSHRSVTPEVLALLSSYSWPGNIRELNNLIAYVLTMTDAQTILPEHLPDKIRNPMPRSCLDKNGATSSATESHDSSTQSFYDQVKQFEKNLLSIVIQQNGKNISQMAAKLGMDRSHLHAKLKQFGLHQPSKRESPIYSSH